MFECWFDDITAWIHDHPGEVGLSSLLYGYTVLAVIRPQLLIAPSSPVLVLHLLAGGIAPALFVAMLYTPLVQTWLWLNDSVPIGPANPDLDADTATLRARAIAWSLLASTVIALATVLRLYLIG